ncbi:hypothetical protein E4L95_22860 [Paracoccus liaowanqingii]|uniref:Uncharacterized protein n=1 Tax=Paracoccus liaowanqingii TaxID=2560053 RepID=A0A4Z1BEX2_9RHOB|nr:hypothetical protein [Paracoccus liaowanqingii]TGN37501.1 hypothetical protein E4L95_22860 [Paracoccus liaowanqingii]
MLCAVLATWFAHCVPEPPPEATQLTEAVMLRPVVEEAIDVANRLLSVSNEPFKITPFWSRDSRASDANEIVVYLMQSPASPAARVAQRNRTAEVLSSMQADQSGIDDAASDCGELDDCVDQLYPEETVNFAIRTLNELTRWEVGKTRKDCRCIVLIEHDLRMFELVFGADWDRYILLTRFAGFPGELEAAIEEDRLPEALTDSETVTLAAMVTLILLHEVGHSTDYSISSTDATMGSGLDELIDSLDEERREELRADAFTGSVLGRACFERRLDPAEENACLAAAELSMLTFVVGMKGKSREARCLRFLDTVPGYPNWQARFMTINLFQYPNASSIGLLRDYIKSKRDADPLLPLLI